MIVPLFASFVTTLFGLALALTAVFLILLVLVQRGRGGGLAGALGGMGGSSAFGAKAGDIFTRITIGAAAVWIVLCIVAAKYSVPTSSRIDISVDNTASSKTDDSASSLPGALKQGEEGAPTSDSQAAETETPATEPPTTEAPETGENSSEATQPPAGGSASSSENSSKAAPGNPLPASSE